MRKNIKYSVEYCQKMAEQKGGKFLSTEYKNVGTKYDWQCANGHIWSTRFSKILAGHWCIYCWKQRYSGEEKCRYVFEWLTNKSFPINCSIIGGQLELDGYCEELKIAFEHQGSQHYKKHKFFASTEEKVKHIQDKDKRKSDRCKELGIYLIIIPYTITENDQEFDFIYNTIKDIVSINKDLTTFNYEDFWRSKHKINTLREYAKNKGGELISTVYDGTMKEMIWKCEKGHIFKRPWDSVKWLNRWCPDCVVWGAKTGPTARKTLSECQEKAGKIGLKILSTEYKNRSVQMEFECMYCGKRFNDIMKRIGKIKQSICECQKK